jgi:hypothetical protein
VLERTKLKPLLCAWNSHTKAKGASNNVMDPNIYLNAIVFYGLAQRDQKQKSVPEPEFRRFDLTYPLYARRYTNSYRRSGWRLLTTQLL